MSKPFPVPPAYQPYLRLPDHDRREIAVAGQETLRALFALHQERLDLHEAYPYNHGRTGVLDGAGGWWPGGEGRGAPSILIERAYHYAMLAAIWERLEATE